MPRFGPPRSFCNTHLYTIMINVNHRKDDRVTNSTDADMVVLVAGGPDVIPPFMYLTAHRSFYSSHGNGDDHVRTAALTSESTSPALSVIIA